MNEFIGAYVITCKGSVGYQNDLKGIKSHQLSAIDSQLSTDLVSHTVYYLLHPKSSPVLFFSTSGTI